MLREFGVKGVKVQEIVSLDDEMLQFIQYARKIHCFLLMVLVDMSG